MRNDFCENYLQHGAAWKDHLYVAKVKLASGKWLYFYDQKIYQNYLAKMNGVKNQEGKNALKEPNKIEPENYLADDKTIQRLVEEKTKGTTVEEKTKNMENDIQKGFDAINSRLNKDEDAKKSRSSKSSESSKKSSGSSSKKKSSGSSKKSSGSSKKSSGGSKSSGSGSSKEKKSASKTQKADSKEKSTSKETKAKESDSSSPLKRIFGVDDSNVNKHSSVSEMLSSMKKYKDGAHGYLRAKDTTYKWEKKGEKIVLIDMETDKEVPINKYLQDVDSIEEFKIDDFKSKYRK